MQLMTSGKKYESRQQEVSDFSRSLKLMAKELDVPVVAISQLNRGPEQRTDKKPMISDLRESGCLTANTRILRADNGAEVTFGELMRTGERPLVWSLDERKRMVARPMTNVFYSGHKEVFKVRLASGREVEATANHPFMTLDGWTPLGELKVGDRVAVPRRVPEPVHTQRMDDSEVILLAHMIGDGSCVKNQPIRYASIDEAEFGSGDERGRALRRDGDPRRLPGGPSDDAAAAGAVPADAWQAESDRGVAGRARVCSASGATKSSCRKRFSRCRTIRWRCSCGTCGRRTARCAGTPRLGRRRIYYASTSRRLVDDVVQLLLRLGIAAGSTAHCKVRLPRLLAPVHRPVPKTRRRFLRNVGVHGEK